MKPDLTAHKILVLGAGNFGTCLAQHLAEEGYEVLLWARSAEVVEHINREHKNPKYLDFIKLPSCLRAINIITPETLQACNVVVLATPMQALRATLAPLAKFFRRDTLLISAVKGIEVSTLKLTEDIIRETLGSEFAATLCHLSGPSFAEEIARHQPTAVAMASRSMEHAEAAQNIFHSSFFRVYTCTDPVGLEVAGALKNVIAIAAGASAGLGFQMNSRGAIITRGLAEITRMGLALGADAMTFQGLGGVGDLFLTCSSEKSRNFSLGFVLGQGKSVADALKTLRSVSEGYSTSKAAHSLSARLGTTTPIIDEVYRVLYEDKPVRQALYDLVSRDAKPEFEH